MTYVHLKDVDVSIPVYDSHALRLIRLPSFRDARVGTNTATRSHGSIIIHALKNLSMEVEEGDRVCLIGHNGAGKTTLLRLVAGIYPPTSGSVDVKGRTFALLGGSISLSPDATGYENIKLIANLYNWPRDKYQDLVREIEEFTELGIYLSLPTRIYSAGMQARLSFALATAQIPDILLIDEGIGAGDAQFQKKAQDRVQHFVGRARILLLASHSANLCRSMCNRALVLSKGEAVFFGDVEEGLKVYVGHLAAGRAEGREDGTPPNDWNEAQYLKIYPDVAAEVQQGTFVSGYHHYLVAGRAEGRNDGKPPNNWNEELYLRVNQDVQHEVTRGTFLSGYHHYLVAGRAEGRNPSGGHGDKERS